MNCENCHDDASASFEHNFHGLATSKGDPKAPNCYICHAADENPHSIMPLDFRNAEKACYQCHKTETSQYDGSVHSQAAAKGLASPGCVSCHINQTL